MNKPSDILISSDAETAQRSGYPLQGFVPHHGRTHLDLFSGIGGFALAAQAVGYETIAFSEIEPYACKILKQTWPTIPNLGDIRNIKGVRADLVTGGFPCQPFSHAGKRRGASDDRALWPEMCRVIDEAKPRWVLGENVAGIISMELDRVLSDLENLGYSAWPIVIPACAVGAPHRRDRVWILANRDGSGGSAEHGEHHAQRPALAGAGRGGNVADTASRKNNGRESGIVAASPERGESLNAAADSSCKDVSDANGRQHESGSAQSNQRTIPGCNEKGWCDWVPEPRVGRVANGIPARTHRLRGLGNAIVPQVAYEILKNLVMGNAPHEPPAHK